MEPGIYIGIKALFSAVAVVLVTTAALSGHARKFSFWVAVAFTALSVVWAGASVSLLVSPTTALQVADILGSQAIYIFAFGALAPALACAAGLATLTRLAR